MNCIGAEPTEPRACEVPVIDATFAFTSATVSLADVGIVMLEPYNGTSDDGISTLTANGPAGPAPGAVCCAACRAAH